ncbi:MAG: Flp pilus assembly complex ATPase component TadA [Candidatus Omnitrophica bacterium]|nr:Flp pilus assembly complex ATPase component TadA [Candidatus Omnitrophota bacterium]
MKNLSERVIELLKKTKRVSETDLERALLAYAKEGKGKLRDVLVEMNLVTEKELVSLLGEELKIPFFNLAKYKINPEIAKMIPEKLARKHQIVPVSKIGKTLTLAMADPLDVLAIDDITLLTHEKIECVISSEKDIQEALDRLYAAESETMSDVASSISASGDEVKFLKSDEELEAHVVGGRGTEAPVVKIVDLMLREALAKRASDIHIEPFEEAMRVRYRIDGSLEKVLTIPKKQQNAVLTRLKIMSKLDITENRVPQDGRFKIRFREKEVDFRVSILPVHFGSKVVMRLLDKSAITVGLDNLGFSPEALKNLKTAITKPFGMLLITGPTGSGKSTTLYSILSQLNTPEKNIITIEDPIEYQVGGITQIQTKSEIGLDFASGLRAVLRQSPDIVMVGEIRDAETADIAVKASLTGQLVLSTLHTNDAAGAMTRLMDMHVEPFLIASSVILVAAQRLCRKICSSCKEKIDIPKEVFERMNISLNKIAPDPKTRVFYRGRGCEKCGKTGYRGRMGILETLLVDDVIRDLVVRRASSYEIKDYAVKKGMTTLRDDALKKFCQGLTTLDEIARVTSEDE